MNPRTSKQAALEGARSVKGYPQSRILLLLSSSGRWPPHTRRRSVEASPWERDRTEQDDPPTSLADGGASSVLVFALPSSKEDLTRPDTPLPVPLLLEFGREGPPPRRAIPAPSYYRAHHTEDRLRTNGRCGPPARRTVSCSSPLYYEEETGKSTKSEQLDKTASMRRAAELIVCLLASI